MSREEARDSLFPRLDRDEGDQAEYLESPNELRGGDEAFFKIHQQMLAIAVFTSAPYGRRLAFLSMGSLKKRQGDCLHGERMVLKESLGEYP